MMVFKSMQELIDEADKFAQSPEGKAQKAKWEVFERTFKPGSVTSLLKISGIKRGSENPEDYYKAKRITGLSEYWYSPTAYNLIFDELMAYLDGPRTKFTNPKFHGGGE